MHLHDTDCTVTSYKQYSNTQPSKPHPSLHGSFFVCLIFFFFTKEEETVDLFAPGLYKIYMIVILMLSAPL